MFVNKINEKDIVLVSQSPRRLELLKSMGIDFFVHKVKTKEEFTSRYPGQIAEEIAFNKLCAAKKEIDANKHLIITADTIVWAENQVLGKPQDRHEAWNMLLTLSDAMHEVYTAVALSYQEKEYVFHEKTKVYFSDLSEEEMIHYIDTFLPFDKAGGYGIQEWVGSIGITKIEGSYENVVGLPTARLYEELKRFL